MKILDLRRFMRALRFSLDGLAEALRRETACQQEFLLLLILVPLAIALDLPIVEKILLISSWLLVIIVEIMNTAVEKVVDLVSPEKHPLAKYAKDLGSSAVLLSLILSLIVWGGILGHRYL